MSFGVWIIVFICLSVFCTKNAVCVSDANIHLFHKLKIVYIKTQNPETVITIRCQESYLGDALALKLLP